MPYFIGFLTLAFLYVFFYGIWSKNWNPAELVVGQDKRPSSSKFQFLLWTVVVVFSYVVLYAARVKKGNFFALESVPVNLLIAMGLSAFTTAAAKGITVGYLETGRIAKTEPPETRPDPDKPCKSVTGKKLADRAGWSAILVDDKGSPDLSKIQMIIWTFIAIGVYLVSFVSLVNNLPDKLTINNKPVALSAVTPADLEAKANLAEANKVNLPDIAAPLMVLMGLGQGAYLGRKLVAANTPRLSQLLPAAGKVGTEVTVSGLSFSETPDGNVVTLNGRPLATPATAVTSAQLKFAFPLVQPDGSAWPPGDVVQVGLLADGQESANALPFTVTVPVLSRLSADQGLPGSPLSLLGSAFGTLQGGLSKVLIDGTAYTAVIPPLDWKDTEIKITVPAALAKGLHQIGASIDGIPLPALPFTVT